jgi:hypothetical protein
MQSEEMSVDESSLDLRISVQVFTGQQNAGERCNTHSSGAGTPDATVQEEKQDLINSDRESDRSRHQRKRPMSNSPSSERRDPLKRRRTAEEERSQDALESLFENMLQVSDTDIRSHDLQQTQTRLERDDHKESEEIWCPYECP